MDKLGKIIKSERKYKYKRLVKLRKARDMASKYSKKKLLQSKVFNFIESHRIDGYLFKSDLAKHILDNQTIICDGYPRPPKPPIQHLTAKK